MENEIKKLLQDILTCLDNYRNLYRHRKSIFSLRFKFFVTGCRGEKFNYDW